jgi:hypothetical protein
MDICTCFYGVPVQRIYKKNIILRPELIPTGFLERILVYILPRRGITIYINNYFTSIPLFKELRSCSYRAVSTTRLYSQFLPEIKELKKRFPKKLE